MVNESWLESIINSSLEKLTFYKNNEKWIVIIDAIEEEIESYKEIIESDEEIASSHNTYSNNNLLTPYCIFKFKDG